MPISGLIERNEKPQLFEAVLMSVWIQLKDVGFWFDSAFGQQRTRHSKGRDLI